MRPLSLPFFSWWVELMSAVGRLAVRYHFETTGLGDAPTHLHAQTPLGELAMTFAPKDRRNPYLLTWALRGAFLSSSSFTAATDARKQGLSRTLKCEKCLGAN